MEPLTPGGTHLERRKRGGISWLAVSRSMVYVSNRVAYLLLCYTVSVCDRGMAAGEQGDCTSIAPQSWR
jgi:hypothetical protein